MTKVTDITPELRRECLRTLDNLLDQLERLHLANQDRVSFAVGQQLDALGMEYPELHTIKEAMNFVFETQSRFLIEIPGTRAKPGPKPKQRELQAA